MEPIVTLSIRDRVRKYAASLDAGSRDEDRRTAAENLYLAAKSLAESALAGAKADPPTMLAEQVREQVKVATKAGERLCKTL